MKSLTSIGDFRDGRQQEVLILGLNEQHLPQYADHRALREGTGADVIHGDTAI